MGTSQVSLPLNLLGKNPLGVCNTPISLTRNRASCGSHHPRFNPLPARLCRATVSPAGSGPAPQWGASRTDRSGSGDRRRTVPTGHLRPHRGRPAPSQRGLSPFGDWGSTSQASLRSNLLGQKALAGFLRTSYPRSRSANSPRTALLPQNRASWSLLLSHPPHIEPGPGKPPLKSRNALCGGIFLSSVVTH